MAKSLQITPKLLAPIIDKALREHYRETMERRRVPNDYVLLFTEGGESAAVADAAAQAQLNRAITLLRKRIDSIEDRSWLTNARQYRKFNEADWQRFKRNIERLGG